VNGSEHHCPVPSEVGVFGGGRMGAGIAHAFAVAGARVVVIETDDASAAAARERVASSLARALEKGVVVLGSAEVSTDPAALAACSLVIEAVPEMVDLKHQVLGRIAEVAPAAVLGSNTSSLSIDQLATAVPDPTRLIGLHFFNPVPVSELVEIVVGARTSPRLVTQAKAWVAGLGKSAITVQDSPGFASSRLGVALAIEAMRMLEDGVASAEDIDTAMTLGYRHPVGPLRTTDIVGLDVRLAIAEHLAKHLGPRFEAPEILRAKVAAGELGRKAGAGFFVW
jgi:3-hydroxybutyryl-CoA dehydrogenase